MWGSHRTKEARLGIQKGSGICTCDVTSKCYCHPGSSTTVSNTTGTAVTTLEPVVSSSTTANLIERVEVNASAHKGKVTLMKCKYVQSRRNHRLLRILTQRNGIFMLLWILSKTFP